MLDTLAILLGLTLLAVVGRFGEAIRTAIPGE